MIATIVVGTDGSQTARRAVGVAAELARRFDAALHVVHGYHAPVAAVGAVQALPSAVVSTVTVWHEVSEAVLDDALADPALAGLHVERHSVPSGASQALIDVAADVGADLIVVGNRGLRSARASSESVPDAVARQAPCHVLIAKTT